MELHEFWPKPAGNNLSAFPLFWVVINSTLGLLTVTFLVRQKSDSHFLGVSPKMELPQCFNFSNSKPQVLILYKGETGGRIPSQKVLAKIHITHKIKGVSRWCQIFRLACQGRFLKLRAVQTLYGVIDMGLN